MLTAQNVASVPAQRSDNRAEPHDDPAVEAARHRLTTVLMDSLLHDARNPLNALSINLEVLAERLRRESGGNLPAQHEKNLKTIREQILRVDAVMKAFADFIAPRAASSEHTDFSSLVHRALEVIAHESRKRRVKLEPIIDPSLKVRSEGARDAQALHFLAVAPLARAVARSPAGEGVMVRLSREGSAAVYRVVDEGRGSDDGDFGQAVEVLAREHRGEAQVANGHVEIRLPLA